MDYLFRLQAHRVLVSAYYAGILVEIYVEIFLQNQLSVLANDYHICDLDDFLKILQQSLSKLQRINHEVLPGDRKDQKTGESSVAPKPVVERLEQDRDVSRLVDDTSHLLKLLDIIYHQ